ncbi:MAG: cytochrome P450, partial [Pseudomonadota bacterium]
VVGAITSVLPARVMMRLFGQPDEDAIQCRDWATAFMLSADLTPEERQASNEAMVQYFTDCVMDLADEEKSGKALRDGLIPAMLTAEIDGERLTLEEVIRFCVTLVVAGAETTTFLLANLLWYLAEMPAVRKRLIAEPDRIPAFIDESLRHSGPPQRLFRVATRDVEIGDKQIKKGDWVALFFGAANHDDQVFPDPERFDLARSNLNRQLSMGLGIHHCLGFAVAKLEAQALVEAVLARFPSIAQGAKPPVPQQTSLLTKSFAQLFIDFGVK